MSQPTAAGKLRKRKLKDAEKRSEEGWASTAPKRRRKTSLPATLPGPNHMPPKKPMDPYSCLKLFITSEIISHIVELTNNSGILF
jgi:hypothetical protein